VKTIIIICALLFSTLAYAQAVPVPIDPITVDQAVLVDRCTVGKAPDPVLGKVPCTVAEGVAWAKAALEAADQSAIRSWTLQADKAAVALDERRAAAAFYRMSEADRCRTRDAEAKQEMGCR
jgi:hypothetical protein